MLKPVYALLGSDLFLQLSGLREILDKAPKDVQRIDLDGESAELADVLDELRSFAMFSSAKVVVIRDADELVIRFREPLEQYVMKPTVGSTLVLRLKSERSNTRLYKAIKATGELIECSPPKDLPQWIVEHGRKVHKLSIGRPEAQILANLVGDDLGRLDNELAKLALLTDGKVDAASINKTVAFQREQEMWDMTDEVASGNAKAALTRWRQLVQLDKSAEFRAMTWLTMWLEKARKALLMRRQGKNEYAIAGELKIWPKEKQAAFFKTANTLGEAGLSRLINLLADLDLRSKSGRGEMAENVERFILAVGAR